MPDSKLSGFGLLQMEPDTGPYLKQEKHDYDDVLTQTLESNEYPPLGRLIVIEKRKTKIED